MKREPHTIPGSIYMKITLVVRVYTDKTRDKTRTRHAIGYIAGDRLLYLDQAGRSHAEHTYFEVDEGKLWIRGWPTLSSSQAKALLAAAALMEVQKAT